MMKERLFKKRHWGIHNLLADEPEEDNQAKVIVKHEVRHLRRVTKRGEKSLKHMSESLEKEVLSQKDIDITIEVIQGLPQAPVAAVPVAKPDEIPCFTCFGCGARIPKDSARCPGCGVRYVGDPTGAALDEGIKDTANGPSEVMDWSIFKEGSISFAHFDFSSGIVTCLQTDEEDTDYGFECHSCGAVTQFGTDRCPLCGHRFDEDDTGLVGILEGLKFDLDGDNELDCPSCGEHVVAEGGRCPRCKDIINYKGVHSHDTGVLTILRERNVVFVHLDAWNGDMWFARKIEWQKPGSSPSVHLDSISRLGFEHDWQSLARM